MDELTISENKDINFELRPSELSILNKVDDVIDSSLVMGDIRPAVVFGRELRRSMQVCGVALAKLLHKIKLHWEVLSETIGDDFYDFVYAEIGTSPTTTSKYIAMWEAIFENPSISSDVKNRLYSQPIRSLLLLTAVARDTTEIINWEEIANASTPEEVRQYVRKIRGEVTSSNTAIRFKLYKNGALTFIRGDEEHPIGIMFLHMVDFDSFVKLGIEKLVQRAGIIGVEDV